MSIHSRAMLIGQTIEHIFQSIPLSLLEVWGSFAFIVGLFLMVFSYGAFTFQTGNEWKFGREWQAWDSNAFLSMGITFIVVWFTGFIGSFFVLVPAAQTFETLKDLSLFLCITLFGYPALLIAPFAYGLSDFYEGVPIDFMSDWWVGYFINPSCFWLAHQLIGKCPDFKHLRTWRLYATFVFLFMTIEPILWGYICTGKFTTEESYYHISPALFFTTFITWCLAPFVMLLAYPFVQKMGLFWAHIPDHVKQRSWRKNSPWIWVSGGENNASRDCKTDSDAGVPIRFFILAPFFVTTLIIMGSTAYFTLKSSSEGATELAERFHEEISEKINLKLENTFRSGADGHVPLENILRDEPTDVFIIKKTGEVISAFRQHQNKTIVTKALEFLKNNYAEEIKQKDFNLQFRLILKSVKNLTKYSWLLQARPVTNRKDLILITAMPESYYLSGVHAGQSQSAMIFAAGLVLVLFLVALLGNMVILPIRRTCHAAHALSQGDLSQRIPGSHLAEMNTLALAFNSMAQSMQDAFNNIKENENRLSLAIHTSNLGIWEWDLLTNETFWNDVMYRHYDVDPNTPITFDFWSKLLLPDDYIRVIKDAQVAIAGEKDFQSEFRVRWRDNTIHILRSHSKVLRDDSGKALKMVGINYDITEARLSEKELMFYRNQLEEVVERRTKDLMQKSAQLQELKEKQAKAEVYKKIAQIFLSMRDYTNSPLQVQNFSIQLLKKRCPEQMDIIENMENSVQKISSINRILSRLESDFGGSTELLSERQILEYLDKIETRA